MSTAAKYVCTALSGTNKQGLLKPDENGYYTVVLGALDIFNSTGAFYPYETAKHLFEGSSSLMRRVKNGALRGEYGHPKKQPGMSMRDYVQRILEIHESDVCCHIKEIVIDRESVKDADGKSVIAIIGKVKPSGPKGDALKASLENPDEGVAFSIRSLTNDVPVRGTIHKNLKTIVTWDYVLEPGLAVATKWNSPTLESHGEEVIITAQNLGSVIDFQKNMGISLESGESMSAEEVLQELGWEMVSLEDDKPTSMDW